jgi:hypothetical protein
MVCPTPPLCSGSNLPPSEVDVQTRDDGVDFVAPGPISNHDMGLICRSKKTLVINQCYRLFLESNFVTSIMFGLSAVALRKDCLFLRGEVTSQKLQKKSQLIKALV